MKRNHERLAPSAPGEAARERKCCRVCGESKPLDQMAKAGLDEHGVQRIASICRGCDADRVRRRVASDPEKERARRRELRADPERRRRENERRRAKYRANPEIERARKRRAAKSSASKRKNTEAVTRWKAAHPEAVKAHRSVAQAERRGDLRRPHFCSVPGCHAPASAAHHEDYDRPLLVKFVCRWHHEEAHHGTPAAVPPPLLAHALGPAPKRA